MRHRVVVLEGPDGSGKSTLAADLRVRLGYTVRHEGPPPLDRDDVFEYYCGRLTLAAVDTFAFPGVVLDRFALGERVYGPILRGRDRLGDVGWRNVRRCLDALGALRVLCLPSYDACHAAWFRRSVVGEEMVLREEVFRRSYLAWDALKGEPGQVRHDWTRAGSTSYVVDRVTGRGQAAA